MKKAKPNAVYRFVKPFGYIPEGYLFETNKEGNGTRTSFPMPSMLVQAFLEDGRIVEESPRVFMVRKPGDLSELMKDVGVGESFPVRQGYIAPYNTHPFPGLKMYLDCPVPTHCCGCGRALLHMIDKTPHHYDDQSGGPRYHSRLRCSSPWWRFEPHTNIRFNENGDQYIPNY